MKTALRTTISLLLVSWLALTFLPARSAQAAEEDASIPPDLLLAALDATSRPPVAGSRTGGLSFTFEAGGLQAAGLDWGVALSKLGREDQVRALGAAEATRTERQTEYRRPELTEWRRATAFGLQQGFTIRSAPSGKGALTLRLSLSTDLRGRLDADKRGLSFPTEDGRTLRYDHLLAWDANGTALDAQLVYAPGEIRIIVQDAGAAYPLTIDPLIYLEQKVIASDGAADDYFGDSVALNAAGDTAIVGTPGDDIGGNAHQGSAYVFARSGGVWSQQAKLTASDGAAYDLFGSSVQLNVAGDTAIVGALWDAIGANAKQGSARCSAAVPRDSPRNVPVLQGRSSCVRRSGVYLCREEPRGALGCRRRELLKARRLGEPELAEDGALRGRDLGALAERAGGPGEAAQLQLLELAAQVRPGV